MKKEISIDNVRPLKRKGREIVWETLDEELLCELFPWTPNRVLAHALGISVESLCIKAGDLGLVKITRRTQEYYRETIIQMSLTSSLVDICKALSVSEWLVLAVWREIGFKKSSGEVNELRSRKAASLAKRERARAVWGFEPLSKRRVVKHTRKAKARARLREAGYVVSRNDNVVYYPSEDMRKMRRERFAAKLGFTFKPLDDSVAI